MTRSPSPHVSVLMAAFNAAAFLDAAIASIRAQTFVDFEFVIIDDGSSDGSSLILARHANEDSRIRVVSQPNQGLIASLNRGLSEARADLVARMDADDVARPERLARQVAAMAQFPNAIVCGTGYDEIDAHGQLLRRRLFPAEPADIRNILKRTNCIAHPTVVMRRQSVLRADGYRRPFLYCEDYDLWLRLSERGDLINLPDALLQYRRHGSNVSPARLEQQIIGEIGARLAAEHRRQGLADPFGGEDTLRREQLEALGVAPHTIANDVMRSALNAARQARAIGDAASAQAMLALAARQKIGFGRARLRYWLMRLKARL